MAALDVGNSSQEEYSSEGPILGDGGSLPTGLEALKPDVSSFANVDTVSYGSGVFNGTSSATPHVAGMLALLWQRMGGVAGSDAEDVRAALLDIAAAGSNDLGTPGPDTQHGQGRVRFQLEDRLVFTQQPSDADASDAIDPAVEVAVIDDESEPVLFGLADAIDLSLAADPSAGVANMTGDYSLVLQGDAGAAFPVLAIDTAGIGYRLKADSMLLNGVGISSPQSDQFDIHALNQAPTLESALIDQSSAEGATVSVNVTSHFSDADGDTLTYTVSGALPDGVSFAGGVFSGTLSYTSAGSYPLTVIASDGTATVSGSFTWTVTDVNQAPVIVAPRGTVTLVAGDFSQIDLDGVFVDLDGDEIVLSAVSVPAWLTLDESGKLSGTPPLDAIGTVVTVSIVAIDAWGLESEISSFQVNVIRPDIFKDGFE